MRSLKFSAISIGFMVLAAFTGSVAVLAESSRGSLLPEEILKLLGLLGPEGICATQYINSRIRLAFFLVLGGLVLAAVIFSIIAAYKYITSQGDTGKIEEANKAIKAILMGVAAMVVGIVGMVLVFVLVGARPTEPALLQTCINAPSSLGCIACQENVRSTLCDTCEGAYEEACRLAENQGIDVVFSEIRTDLPAECTEAYKQDY